MGRKVSSGDRRSGRRFSWRENRHHFSCSFFFLSSFLFCTWVILLLPVLPLSRTVSPSIARASFFVQSASIPADASSSSASASKAANSPFSAAYLAEVEEMEAAEARKHASVPSIDEEYVPISEEEEELLRESRERETATTPNIVEKRFWGPKSDRVDNLPFVIPFLGEGGGPSSKRYMRSSQDFDEEDDGDEEDVMVREPEIMFPLLYGTTFMVDHDEPYDDPFPIRMADPRQPRSNGRRASEAVPRKVVSPEERKRRENASQRIQLRVQKEQARQKPHEEGCYLVALELLHRVRKVQPVIEKVYTDALGRYNELQSNYSRMEKAIQKDRQGSASFPVASNTTVEVPPYVSQSVPLQQAAVVLRHAKHTLEAAAEELKAFHARTWVGLSWKVANRCLAEAARYRYYLLHRELPSMTLASLPPPAVALYYGDDDGDDDDDDDDWNAEEEEATEVEGESKKSAPIYTDAEIEDTPEMEDEKKNFRERYRELYQEKRRKRAKGPMTDRTADEESEEIEKEEKEIETLMHTKYKPFLLSQARERIEADMKGRQKQEEEKKQKQRKKRRREGKGMPGASRQRGGGARIDEANVRRTTRSRKTLEHGIRVQNIKPEDYMTFSQVLRQCRTFSRNVVYGFVLPPFYILRQLSAAVVDFYWDEFFLTSTPHAVGMGEEKERHVKATTTTTHTEGLPWRWSSVISLPSRLAQWGGNQVNAWRLQIATKTGLKSGGRTGEEEGTSAPAPPPVHAWKGESQQAVRESGSGSFVTSSSPISSAFFSLHHDAGESVFWLQVWVLGFAGSIVCFLLGPFVLFFLFFRELFFQLMFCPFFLQYLLRLQANPFPIWKNIVVVHLLQHRQPKEALAALHTWWTSAQTRFHTQGGFGRWWKQTEAFLCLTTVLAFILVAWVVGKVCRRWLRFIVCGRNGMGGGGRKKVVQRNEKQETTIKAENKKEIPNVETEEEYDEETEETESEKEESKKDR